MFADRQAGFSATREAPNDNEVGKNNDQSAILNFITDVATAIVLAAVVFAGVIPYYFQAKEIRRTQNADGFSLYVCLTLLMANILRILFWWGRRFETPLLLQSIVMTICMLTMINVSVRVRQRQVGASHQPRTIFNGNAFSHFWRWSDFSSYLVATGVFTACAAALTQAFLLWPIYIETVGFLALFLEANLGSPQLYANLKRKSTAGMSVGMVLMWFAGDVSKTIYFLVRNTPAQFWLCGLYQIGVDIAILMQVRWYRSYSAVPVLKSVKSDPAT